MLSVHVISGVIYAQCTMYSTYILDIVFQQKYLPNYCVGNNIVYLPIEMSQLQPVDSNRENHLK